MVGMVSNEPPPAMTLINPAMTPTVARRARDKGVISKGMGALAG